MPVIVLFLIIGVTSHLCAFFCVSTPVISIMPSLFDPSDIPPASTAKMDSVCLRLLPEGRSITGKIDAHGVSKVAKANSNSSNRQKAASMKALVDTKTASKDSRRNQRERSRRKALKQGNSLDLIHPDPEKDITHEVIKSSIVFVDGGDCNNPRILSSLYSNARTNTKSSPCASHHSLMVIFHHPTLTLITLSVISSFLGHPVKAYLFQGLVVSSTRV